MYKLTYDQTYSESCVNHRDINTSAMKSLPFESNIWRTAKHNWYLRISVAWHTKIGSNSASRTCQHLNLSSLGHVSVFWELDFFPMMFTINVIFCLKQLYGQHCVLNHHLWPGANLSSHHGYNAESAHTFHAVYGLNLLIIVSLSS